MLKKLLSGNFDKLLVFISQGYTPLVNFVTFTLLSNAISVNKMGDYVTIYALSLFFTAFIGLGHSYYIFRNLANNSKAVSSTWGKLLYLDLLSFVVSFPIYLFLANEWVSASASIELIVLIFVTESLIVVLINDVTLIFQSLQSFRAFSLIKMAFSTMRLLSVLPISLGLILFDDKLFGYYLVSLVTLLLFYGVILVYTGSAFSYPKLAFRDFAEFGTFKDGLLYSFGNFSKNAYNDVDKLMLSNITGTYEAGLYGVITRIGNSIKLPLDTYLLITFPNYFRLSQRNVAYSYLYYLKKLSWYLLFGTLSVGAAFVFVWLLPVFFPKYQEGSKLLMIFSGSFLLKAAYMPLADILTSSGRQVIRTILQVSVGIFNVLLNLFFIRNYGMFGAVYSTMLSELLLFIVLVIVIRKTVRT